MIISSLFIKSYLLFSTGSYFFLSWIVYWTRRNLPRLHTIYTPLPPTLPPLLDNDSPLLYNQQASLVKFLQQLKNGIVQDMSNNLLRLIHSQKDVHPCLPFTVHWERVISKSLITYNNYTNSMCILCSLVPMEVPSFSCIGRGLGIGTRLVYNYVQFMALR